MSTSVNTSFYGSEIHSSSKLTVHFVVSGNYLQAARGESEAQGLRDPSMNAGRSGTNARATDFPSVLLPASPSQSLGLSSILSPRALLIPTTPARKSASSLEP